MVGLSIQGQYHSAIEFVSAAVGLCQRVSSDSGSESGEPELRSSDPQGVHAEKVKKKQDLIFFSSGSSESRDLYKKRGGEEEEAMADRYWCHMCSQIVNPILDAEIKCPWELAHWDCENDEEESLEEGCSKADDEDDSEDEFMVPDEYLLEDMGVQVDRMKIDPSEQDASSPPSKQQDQESREFHALLHQQKQLQRISKVVETLQQKFPDVPKTKLREKVREISDFEDNRWQAVVTLPMCSWE
ncbi:unnamed protein product [Eruca vesicaria subsp. sativa]|uniref:Chromatin assembly factor 1 subunit Cac1-like C-terminal domain-containing protein n=1 Tax=Eruca vesicaria subsp. sativa TaxID=29727 RepID=A0ABC8LWR8_ERUVS|nr:unnamed protein product [Eruca vesicaria subsp. sativa]